MEEISKPKRPPPVLCIRKAVARKALGENASLTQSGEGANGIDVVNLRHLDRRRQACARRGISWSIGVARLANASW